jgi:type 1 glutamine amidotransferase
VKTPAGPTSAPERATTSGGRRVFLRSSLAAGLGAVGGAAMASPHRRDPAGHQSNPGGEPNQGSGAGAGGRERRRALFVYGGWEGHEPEKCRDLFVPWMRSIGWDVTVSASQDSYADKALMDEVDVVVQTWTQGTISRENLQGLLDAVRGGAGLAGWHGGLGDAYREETEYQFMVGGQWVAHPGGVIDYTVEIVDHDDPITAGLRDFAVHSEQYYMHVDPNNAVLATTRFDGRHAFWIEGATMPVAWKRVYGRGRVFYTSLGHDADVFAIPEAFAIATRGITWAADSRHAPTPRLVRPVYPPR